MLNRCRQVQPKQSSAATQGKLSLTSSQPCTSAEDTLDICLIENTATVNHMQNCCTRVNTSMHLKPLLNWCLKWVPHLGTGNYDQNTCIYNRLLGTAFKIASENALFSASYYQLYLGSNGFNLEKQFSKTNGLCVTSGLLHDLFSSCTLRKLTNTEGINSYEPHMLWIHKTPVFKF